MKETGRFTRLLDQHTESDTQFYAINGAIISIDLISQTA